MEDFFFDHVMPFIGKALLLFVAFLIVVFGFDWVVFSRRAFTAETACLVKRELPKRKLWSDQVVCIPVPLGQRNDTTTVQIKQ